MPPLLPVASVTDVVYGRLRTLILRGLAPGSPLRLNELAEEMGVSTTPVRVAMERLRAEGLVVHHRGKGSRVAPLSIADLEDIYAVRIGLEGVAARRGTARISAAEVGTMSQQIQRLAQLDPGKLEDRQTYLGVEWSMHEVCYGAAGHPRLLQEIRSYRRQTERYFRLALAGGIRARDDFQHQVDFYQACASRNPAEAERLARGLLEWTVERVVALLRELPEAAGPLGRQPQDAA